MHMVCLAQPQYRSIAEREEHYRLLSGGRDSGPIGNPFAGNPEKFSYLFYWSRPRPRAAVHA
jgi:hypothetical protein